MHSLSVIVTDYDSHAREIRDIRDDVFIREQCIRREDEIDDRDEVCVHVLGMLDGQPVGTGRLDPGKSGKLGRFAVLAPYRRLGVGSAMVRAFEQWGAENELEKIWFHAQKNAIPFYLSQGYKIVGDEFWEAGIPHVVMQKDIHSGIH